MQTLTLDLNAGCMKKYQDEDQIIQEEDLRMRNIEKEMKKENDDYNPNARQ